MRFFVSLFVLAISASAQADSNVKSFGIVGMAEGQTARLNVLNVGGQGQAAQCIASLVFLSDQGEVLKVRTLSVLPGRSVSLDLDADTDLELAASQRRQIRAALAQLPATGSQENASCVLAPTLEIFDRLTGKTSIIMTNSIPIPQPPPSATQP